MAEQETIARRTARLLDTMRPLVKGLEGDGRFDLSRAPFHLLKAYDMSATYVDGLLDTTLGPSIVMIYKDGSRLRVANDLVPHIVPTGEKK